MSSRSSVASPALTATGFPLSVPAWYTGPRGATLSMIARFPPYAASGSPPPTIFPRHVMSGLSPARSCIPPRATRQPVITSSKIETAPLLAHPSRIASRNPGSGGTSPMFPTTGSTMTAAIVSPRAAKRARSAGMSLYGSVTVFAAVLAGTPAESGMPSVMAPEPAFTRRKSACPW